MSYGLENRALLKLTITNPLLDEPIKHEMLLKGNTLKSMLDPMMFTKRQRDFLIKTKKITLRDKHGSIHNFELHPDYGVINNYQGYESST
jgi:hypothetical protein